MLKNVLLIFCSAHTIALKRDDMSVLGFFCLLFITSAITHYIRLKVPSTGYSAQTFLIILLFYCMTGNTFVEVTLEIIHHFSMKMNKCVSQSIAKQAYVYCAAYVIASLHNLCYKDTESND